MVQAKKSSVKKKPIVKAVAARKPAVRKAPAKRATTVRTRVARKSSTASYKTFKLAPGPKFMSTAVTEQTIYWAVLGIVVLAFGAWVLVVNDRIQRIYDQIDAQMSATYTTK
jgi:hypothetical protein